MAGLNPWLAVAALTAGVLATKLVPAALAPGRLPGRWAGFFELLPVATLAGLAAISIGRPEAGARWDVLLGVCAGAGLALLLKLRGGRA